MKTYRVLKAFQNYAINAVIELEDDEAKGLLMGGVVAEVVEDTATAEFRKGIEEQLRKVAAEAASAGAAEALSKASASVKGVKITVGQSEGEKLMSTGGFKNFGHFAYEVYKAGKNGQSAGHILTRYSDMLTTKAASGMNELVDSEGGYLIPTEQSTELLNIALEASIVRPRARVIPMSSSHIEIPAMKDEDRSSTLFGGVQVFRTGEGGQVTGSQPAFRKIGLKLTKLTGLCYVTDEMLQDSPISVEALVMNLFPQAIAYKEDEEFLTANGAGKPLGIQNAANNSKIAVPKEAAQVKETINSQNILKMYSRAWGKNNAVWVANHNTFPQLATMVLSVGTGGVPLWLPGNNTGLAGAPNGTLLGRPLLLTEQVPTLGTEGDVGLYDFSQYLIGERSGEGLQSATSIHLRFDYGEVAFRFTLRNDGQPWWRAPLTPKNGDTLSPFVTLATRA